MTDNHHSITLPDDRIDLGLSYEAALHGIQSAIAYEMGRGRHPATEPKHMRVGIDSAHISDAALVLLLVQKNIISREEYEESVRRQANNELARYDAKHQPFKFR